MGLTLTNNAPTLTMSSREIAELTGKRHDNVMADVRTMLDQLGKTSPEFSGHLPDAYGRMQPCFHLPHDLTITLVSGYSVPLRHRIVTRWKELEAQVSKPVPMTQTMGQGQRREPAAVKSLA